MRDALLHRWLRIPYTLHVHTNRAPTRPKATVLFIHGIGNSGAAWGDVIARLPDDLHVITIDLLGFGSSPRPRWATYSAKTQARSVIATLVKLRLRRPVIIVGHSLGALVAVEVAKRYPLIVRSLILCSPPFYQPPDTPARYDTLLRSLYRLIHRHPEQTIKISALALRLGLVNKAFSLDEKALPSYMGALEASIINQTSLEDAKRLKKPTHVLAGRLDPVVVGRNLKELAATNPHVELTSVTAGHEVQGRLVPAAVSAIIQASKSPRKTSRGRQPVV